MSVPKSRRTKSKLEVLYNANKLHEALSSLVLRSFGIYSSNSPLRHKYQLLIAKEENEAYVSSMILNYKNAILNTASDIEVLLNQAKTIYPSTELRLNKRIEYQLDAIADCVKIKTYLREIAQMFDVDLSVFKESIELLNTEIKLITSWQRADIRKYRKEASI